jgi:hypothetical protein
MAKKSLTRRDFIKVAGATLGTSVLAACAPQVVTQVVTSVVEQTKVVTEKQTQIVNQVITATPVPTAIPEPAVLDIWWNTNLPDLTLEWKADPNNDEFKKEWFWGGLGRLKYLPFMTKHPGVKLNITSHSWDTDLRQNQLLALASGIVPDTTYGEAYVLEFVGLGVYADLDPAAAALFAPGPLTGATKGGKFYGFPKSTGCDVVFVNLDKAAAAKLDTTKLPQTWDELLAWNTAISKINYSAKWGNTSWFNYGPCTCETYGIAMRVLHWFDQNNCPLADADMNPTANTAGAADTWLYVSKLMWTSSYNLIMQGDSEVGSGQLFNNGVIALKIGWNNDATSVGTMKPSVNAVGIPIPIPQGGKPATKLVGNDVESAFKGSKHVDLAKAVVTESTTDETAQAFLADNAGIWIPALKSQLSQAKTYDKLGGYQTDVAKAIVRVTMDQALNGNASQIPAWSRNGSQIWTAWNASFGRIWGTKPPGLDKAGIQTELDALQKTITGLLVKTG